MQGNLVRAGVCTERLSLPALSLPSQYPGEYSVEERMSSPLGSHRDVLVAAEPALVLGWPALVYRGPRGWGALLWSWDPGFWF